MTLEDWFKLQPYGAKKLFAEELGITPTWLGLILAGRKKCSAALAKAIEKETRRMVKAKTLRPDLFGK